MSKLPIPQALVCPHTVRKPISDNQPDGPWGTQCCQLSELICLMFLQLFPCSTTNFPVPCDNPIPVSSMLQLKFLCIIIGFLPQSLKCRETTVLQRLFKNIYFLFGIWFVDWEDIQICDQFKAGDGATVLQFGFAVNEQNF